ncbi:uncharacterized protein F5147DRAFT_778998 [Suillus discolor]|uniref:Uncharacterized protein n=1 Tax=Suillus discolor TaxID=1912936 RepID=A0A9P7EXR2_9AGAM|nr:uncharacterized protein F5147DRAFT_778998 [Suillus discolor]KAG2094394.1 hypothetical protein F5147DRAFT_778998 [Suillus discolor]
MIQEIFTPAAGYISAITWMHVDDRSEASFAFGASDGNIQVYERSNEALFEFQSTTIGHSSAVESLAWDPVHRRLASAGSGRPHVWKFTSDKTLVPITSHPEKQPYVARTVHFYDNGASLLVSFLESGEMLVDDCILVFSQTLAFRFCYSIEPWDLKWRKKVQGRIGNAVLEGNFLLSYNHVILCNVPLQISIAREAGLVFVGGDDGFARVFDYNTGAYRGQLTHGNRGDQIIPVASHEGRAGCTVVTGSCFNGHSNVKVWEEGESISMEEDVMPAPPLAGASSTLQLARFAIICVDNPSSFTASATTMSPPLTCEIYVEMLESEEKSEWIMDVDADVFMEILKLEGDSDGCMDVDADALTEILKLEGDSDGCMDVDADAFMEILKLEGDSDGCMDVDADAFTEILKLEGDSDCCMDVDADAFTVHTS